MKRRLALLLACLLVFGGLLLAQEGGDEPTTDDLSWAAYIVEAVHDAVETTWVYLFPDRNEWGDIFPSLPGFPPSGGGGGGGPGNRPPPTEEELEDCFDIIAWDIDMEQRINLRNSTILEMHRNGVLEFRRDSELIRIYPGSQEWKDSLGQFVFDVRKWREMKAEMEDEVKDCMEKF